MTSRDVFEERLNEIRQGAIRMAECVEEMTRRVCDAVVQSDLELARSVVVMDDVVDRLEAESVKSVIRTMMRQAPVASDLKFLTATLGVVTEIEQAGDDVVKLARRTIKLSGQFPVELKRDIAELGEKVRASMAQSVRLYIDYSDELANEVIATDKEIDRLYKDARNRIVDMVVAEPERTRQFLRVIDAFHSLEHVADHSVEIAKRMKTHFGRDEAISESSPA